MTKKASIGAGNIPITLDGEDVVLRPTLKAAMTISRQSGGIVAAIDASTKFDLDTITSIIALGLNEERKAVEEKVWRTGMDYCASKAIEFLGVLSNGGRPLSPDKEDDGGEGEENPPKE